MTAQELLDTLSSRFGSAILESKLDVNQPWIKIDGNRAREICLFLRNEPSTRFDYLMCLSGVDYNDGTLGVVYHCSSMEHKHKIVLKAICSKDNPHCQSVSAVWGTANWHEREAFDMFGIIFDGHPDLRRILLPDDWEGHPLRKDYKVQEFYRGIRVPY
ncbi:MAG: NADH-quinone oxidoreductase subunit C [Ignavibacteria bacterium]|nr:NADH-quinone oxidoreductase subunit C [Ignavibacteria bacterium]